VTDIEQKALAQAVAAAGRRLQDYAIMAEENVLRQSIEAHARAIEQHERFRQEVSFALETFKHGNTRILHSYLLDPFIIPQPDPLVEAWIEATGNTVGMEPLNAAIEKRGGKIVWGGD
jgi:glyceraldehyde-3-phosphate dehydrogenase/erythrose-4-phosphate dehydrogenase